MKISTKLSCYAFICLLWMACTNKHEAAPNIILIMADDLGYGDLSCYGNNNIQTTHIDQLAKEGIRFTDYHSNGAVCSPTRAAMMSGLYQQKVGINGVVYTYLRDSLGMSQSVVTLAELLKEKDYQTAIFGKWHLGYKTIFNPLYQGFDEFKGFVAGNVDYHSHLDNMLVFDWWSDTTLQDDKGYSTSLITSYAEEFLKRRHQSPFFLYLPYAAPHDPYQTKNDPPIRLQGKANRIIADSAISRIYKDMILSLDEGVGRINQLVKDLGLEDNTIIIFCSDNGANRHGSNGELRGHKGGVYEGGHRVPAILKWPSVVKPSSVSNDLIMSMDWYPTLLDAANIQTEMLELDGINLASSLTATIPEEAERTTFWDYNGKYALRSGKLKLVKMGKEWELFDLENDLGEQKNIANQKSSLVDSLVNTFEEWQATIATTQ